MKKSKLNEAVMDFRTKVETASQTISDGNAQSCVALYPHWNEQAHYSVGYRVQYNEVVYKCLQEHDAQPTWTPTDAPSLWAKVLVPSPDVIPDWEQPTSTSYYKLGDKVQFEGHIYESLLDVNLYSPKDDPSGWKLIE